MKRELLAQSLAQISDAPEDAKTRPPAGGSGAPRSLQAMSEVMSKVTAQSAQDIDVSEIGDSEIADRFDVEDGLEDLVTSIKTSGQQLPALLRYRRGSGPRYEVVYGRRRIAACRVLGIKVKAYIQEMDERQALVSQALENSARLERSFIEQAIFATKLEGHEFTRAEICEVLAVDKGTLSKLIGVARDIPTEAIMAIGAAHEAGRRPWLELRRLSKSIGNEAEIVERVPATGTPVEKLSALITALQQMEAGQKEKTKASPAPLRMRSLGNTPVSLKSNGKRMVLEVSQKDGQGFLDFVEQQLEAIYQTWKNSSGQQDKDV